jgi:acyl-CoA synthetase (AMP-forming)/AMP-acid ligase II
MLLDMAADGFVGRVAVGSGDEGLMYETLRANATGLAARLDDSGVTSLALAAANGPIVPITLFGAAWAGISYAPINYRLPEPAQQELIARLEPAAVIRDDSVDLTGHARHRYPDDPKHPAALLFTSGTAAAPKAAVLGHDHLISYVLTTTEFASAGEEEANLLSAPPFHIAGLVAVLTSTYAGRRIVPLAAFSPDAWLKVARRERVTHAFVVPTMLARIVAAMEADEHARVPSLRTLTYGGARMPLPVLERALALLPETGFVNAYGLTETSATVCLLGPDDHRAAASSDDPAVRRRLESAGRPLPGVEIRIDCEGRETRPGDIGEVLVRGAQVSGDYLEQQSVRDDSGWMHTGDVGFLDDDGYLFVVGRADDMIIRGGENISPTEIENTLLAHPAVAAAAVVGLPDPEWGERVAAMVVLRRRASTRDIRDWARARLGSLKAPDVLVARDELPITATGKVLLRQVRAEIEDV